MGLINKKSEERQGMSTQPPTDLRCPANGCCLPCDMPDHANGGFACVFHAGRPRCQWNTITNVVDRWLPAWVLVHQLDRNMGNEIIADLITQRLNALDVVVKSGLHFVSELEAEKLSRKYQRRVPYDYPIMKLQVAIGREIEESIRAAEGKQREQDRVSEASAVRTQLEQISTMCKRIANRNLRGMRVTEEVF